MAERSPARRVVRIWTAHSVGVSSDRGGRTWYKCISRELLKAVNQNISVLSVPLLVKFPDMGEPSFRMCHLLAPCCGCRWFPWDLIAVWAGEWQMLQPSDIFSPGPYAAGLKSSSTSSLKLAMRLIRRQLHSATVGWLASSNLYL